MLSLCLVSCRCEVSSTDEGASVRIGNAVDTDLPEGDIQVLKKWTADNDPNEFQSMRVYEVCLDGVVYYWEYMRDEMFVAYDPNTKEIKLCNAEDTTYRQGL